MAFSIRFITHSATGKEIVRPPQRVEGDRLTIGRGPDNDLHLTDLAVALRHATAERKAGHLDVRVEEGLTVELNGRKLAAGRIELATGGDILIASHLLRFMPLAADSDEIIVNVEKVTESEVKLDKGAERMFSIAWVMPSKRAWAWALAVLVLGLFVAWPVSTFYQRHQSAREIEALGRLPDKKESRILVERARAEEMRRFHADDMWLSGGLTGVHVGLENGCVACHVKPFEAVRDTACLACHADIEDHARPALMTQAMPEPGRLASVQLAVKEKFDLPPGRCVDCHTEHEGARRMPFTAQRFCSDCHARLDARLPRTELPNAGDFAASHPRFRPEAIIGWDGDTPRRARVSLAGLPAEDSGLKFPHAKHLNPLGGPARMAQRLGASYGFGSQLECKDCHDPTPDGVRFLPVDMEEDCAMCHSLAIDRVGGTLRTLRHGEPEQVVADLRDFFRNRRPPLPPSLGPAARRPPGEAQAASTRFQFERAVAGLDAERAIRMVFSPKGACHDCHEVIAPPRGSLAFRIRPVEQNARYLRHGWFSHRPHMQTACASCHVRADESQSASDLLLPDLGTCRTCHGGERTSKPVASSCAMCHDYHRDQGAPSMLIRQQVHGRKRTKVVARAESR